MKNCLTSNLRTVTPIRVERLLKLPGSMTGLRLIFTFLSMENVFLLTKIKAIY